MSMIMNNNSMTAQKKSVGKADNILVTKEFLDKRASYSINKGYGKQKWIIFCEALLLEGYSIRLYEAKNTFSKYVTVIKDKKQFKVRFSNHKPIYQREIKKDCDFFVGVTHTGVRTTEDALIKIKNYFKGLH